MIMTSYLTSFSILRSRNVLSTESPDPSDWLSSSAVERTTMTPSNRLNPDWMYLPKPSASSLRSISRPKINVNKMFDNSTAKVSSCGCWWYSMPIERVFTRIAARIPRCRATFEGEENQMNLFSSDFEFSHQITTLRKWKAVFIWFQNLMRRLPSACELFKFNWTGIS